MTPSTSLEESSANCRSGLCGHPRPDSFLPGSALGARRFALDFADDCFDVDLLLADFLDVDFFDVPAPCGAVCSAMSSLSCSSLARSSDAR